MTNASEFPKLREAATEGVQEVAPEGRSVLIRIRLRKEDSAYVYAIFEANEGVAAYSTLEHQAGDLHRDLEFIVPTSQMSEMRRLLDLLKEELHGHLILLSERDSEERPDPVRNP